MSPDAVAHRPLRVELLEGGAIRRVTLSGGKGNVLDTAMIDALADEVDAAASASQVKAVVLDAAGEHFSYGASVEEHLPEAAPAMLVRFHGLLRAMLDASVPFLAAVRGRCLGGGFELVSFCHRVFAHEGAVFAQPELTLGVFAPAASAILPERVGPAVADDLLLTGRSVVAKEAHRLGLVDEVVDDPTAAALAWARTHLLPKSASSLRYATRAARHALSARVSSTLSDLERFYVDGLLGTHDGAEGIRAFLAKRPPHWTDR